MSIIMSNAARFAVVAGIGSVFTILGKLFIALVTGVIIYLILTNSDYYTERLFSPMLPTILAIGLAYMVGILFMTIYGNSKFILLYFLSKQDSI